MPAVSVVIPVYNAAAFVAETLDTVLAQTFGDFECIAIDDGSKDDSLAILNRYAAKDARIVIISRPNKGLVATLNEAVAVAKAPLLARLDADDLCDPRRFEQQVAAMQADPRLVALGSGAWAIDQDGRMLGDYSPPTTHEEIEAAHLLGNSSIHHPAVMLRADAVRQVSGYRDLVPCEDFDLWLRLGEIGRVGNLSEKLISKRLMVGGLVGTNMDRRDRVLRTIMQDAWTRRKLPGNPPVPATAMLTRGDLYRQWGWMALKAGEKKTSRRYATRAMLDEPGRLSSWKLLACAIRGR